MGNITISLQDKDEKKLRHFAKEKFYGKKGSMAKVVAEGLKMLEKESEKEMARQRLIAHMNKGHNIGKLLYKHRSELYDR